MYRHCKFGYKWHVADMVAMVKAAYIRQFVT